MQEIHWYPLPDSRFARHGLPAVSRGFHRLPDAVPLPPAVLEQARFAAGGRLRFATNSARLHLRCQGRSDSRGHGIDCLVDGICWKTLSLSRGDVSDALIFQGQDNVVRQIELYLPHEQEVNLLAIGLEAGAQIDTASSYSEELPLVFYGSSIVQGAGVSLSCMSYPAIVARTLNSDFINWGFYGAGRGEPEVVHYVADSQARILILDLGKSWGQQPVETYRRMLVQLRQSQPHTPILVITPIFSTRECFDRRFHQRSESIRAVMREAATVTDLEGIVLVEGLELLGEADWTGLSADGLHPNEKGCDTIARRLLSVINGFYHA